MRRKPSKVWNSDYLGWIGACGGVDPAVRCRRTPHAEYQAQGMAQQLHIQSSGQKALQTTLAGAGT